MPGAAKLRPSNVLLPALAQLPGHLLWRAHARVSLAVASQLPAGVDVHQYATLEALDGRVPLSQQKLSRLISVSRSTMVVVAEQLLAAGLVERTRNPTDRRSYALIRSPDGTVAVRRLRRHVSSLEGVLREPFSQAQAQRLQTLLLAVVRPELAQDTPAPLLQSIGFLVTRAHARMHGDFQRALSTLGIEPRHYGTLTALRETGPISQTELAALLGVSAATVVQIADDLERRGAVARRQQESDRRIRHLHLLPGTDALLGQAAQASDRTTAELFGPLDDADRAELVLLLRRFVTAPV